MMKKMIGLALVSLMVCSAAHAVIIAQDSADDAAYNDGWTLGDNGGTGFGAWTGDVSDPSMATIGDATGLDPALSSLNTSGEAFKILGGDPTYVQTLRDFSAPLNIDETFSIDFAAGGPFNNQGFAVRAIGSNVGSTAIVQLAQRSNGWELANYASASSSAFADGASDNSLFQFSATQTSAGGGEFTFTRSGTFSETITGTYNGTIGAFKFYARVNDASDTGAIFANNMMISAVPEPATLGLLGLAFGGLVMLRRRSK